MDPNWQPNPFLNVWTGHLFIGYIFGFITFLIAAIILWFSPFTVEALPLTLIMIVAVIISETLSTIFDRYYAALHHHNAPGGWPPIMVHGLGLVLGYFPLGYLLAGLGPAIILSCVAVIIKIISVFSLKEWKPGLTRAQVDKAWKDTVDMTRATIQREQDPDA